MERMTCRQFQDVVHAMVRMELLDLRARDAAHDHAESCAACAALLAEAERLDAWTEAVARSTAHEETPAHVEEALLAQFRQEHSRRALWGWRWEWAASGLIAASMALLVWISVPDLGSRLTNMGRSTSGPARGGSGANGADPDAAEVQLAQFTPLPLGDGLEPDDTGMIVQVELTRAALGKLGYPVGKRDAKEVVRADLLVGENGWPRAVRLRE